MGKADLDSFEASSFYFSVSLIKGAPRLRRGALSLPDYVAGDRGAVGG